MQKIENITELTKELKYDWRKIWRECRKLGIPSHVWNPFGMEMNTQAYIVDISERSTGKTTQWLITALVMNRIYGTTFAYLRQNPTQITPKNCGQVFKTIKEKGYIEQITDGKYKDIYLWGGVFRYCNRDDKTQKVIEQSEPIGYALAITESDNYKSNFNVPNCDILIFDEFISSKYYDGEFGQFLDILSTVGRQRAEVYIIMLANTLNYYNTYLQELGISRAVSKMSFGEKKMIETGMVRVFVELIDMTVQHKTKVGQMIERITQFRFGFGNSKYNAITGGSWNIKQYPHVTDFIDIKNDKKYGMFVVTIGVDTIKGELFKHDGKEYIFFSPYRSTYRGDIRKYTLSQPSVEIERFGFGFDKKDKVIWTHVLKTDRVYFANNETGLILDEFIQRASVEKFI